MLIRIIILRIIIIIKNYIDRYYSCVYVGWKLHINACLHGYRPNLLTRVLIGDVSSQPIRFISNVCKQHKRTETHVRFARGNGSEYWLISRNFHAVLFELARHNCNWEQSPNVLDFMILSLYCLQIVRWHFYD